MRGPPPALLDHPGDLLSHHLRIAELFVANAEHSKSHEMQRGCSRVVVIEHGWVSEMMPPIELYHQLQLRTVEIDDEWPDGNLSAELVAEALGTQPSPHARLGGRRAAAHFAGVVEKRAVLARHTQKRYLGWPCLRSVDGATPSSAFGTFSPCAAGGEG